MDESAQQKKMLKVAAIVGGIIVLIVVLKSINPFIIVGAGQRGVVMNWGAVSDTVLLEGIHIRVPIMQEVQIIDVQTQKLVIETLAYSKDIQSVKTKLALNYHVRPESVNGLWQKVGHDFMARLIEPAVQESVKAAAAQFTAQQLIEERPRVKEEIKRELFERLENYFTLDEFSITDFSFSDDFEKAVEEKQVAQQKALKASNDLDRIKTEAAQRIAQAEAEAKAIRLQAEAITQQGGRDYVQLKAIEKWDGKLPAQMIPGSTVPFLNLQMEK